MTRILTAVLFVSILAVTFATAAEARGRRNPHPAPVIYVTSQSLYFDSIVTADPLPRRGRFQKLEVVNGRLQTMWGPGDRGYVGGRWWMDTNSNGRQDDGDHFFSCPLQGPGRTTP